LRDHKAQLDQAGIRVVLVGMGTPAETEEFRRQFDLPFPFICDPEKKLYSMYGLQRAGFKEIASPRMFIKGLRLMADGHTPGVPRGDTMQLAGTFVINKGGLFLRRHLAKDIADHLPIETIVQAVKDVQQQA
jgi:AhpC/TSA antioxidant enzyme